VSEYGKPGMQNSVDQLSYWSYDGLLASHVVASKGLKELDLMLWLL
jgi:hypothetical protein